MSTQSPRLGVGVVSAERATAEGTPRPVGAQAPASPQDLAARAFTGPADAGTPEESPAAHLGNALQMLRVLPDAAWEVAWRELTAAVRRIRRAHAQLLDADHPSAQLLASAVAGFEAACDTMQAGAR